MTPGSYGIHSYLTYLRDRLTVAKDLLTESGSIFVQIGDENVHLVRSLDGRGIWQRELRISLITVHEDWRGSNDRLLSSVLRLPPLVRETDGRQLKYPPTLFEPKRLDLAGSAASYDYVETADGESDRRPREARERGNSRRLLVDNLHSQSYRSR